MSSEQPRKREFSGESMSPIKTQVAVTVPAIDLGVAGKWRLGATISEGIDALIEQLNGHQRGIFGRSVDFATRIPGGERINIKVRTWTDRTASQVDKLAKTLIAEPAVLIVHASHDPDIRRRWDDEYRLHLADLRQKRLACERYLHFCDDELGYPCLAEQIPHVTPADPELGGVRKDDFAAELWVDEGDLWIGDAVEARGVVPHVARAA